MATHVDKARVKKKKNEIVKTYKLLGELLGVKKKEKGK